MQLLRAGDSLVAIFPTTTNIARALIEAGGGDGERRLRVPTSQLLVGEVSAKDGSPFMDAHGNPKKRDQE